jgi:hypothetical protein
MSQGETVNSGDMTGIRLLIPDRVPRNSMWNNLYPGPFHGTRDCGFGITINGLGVPINRFGDTILN